MLMTQSSIEEKYCCSREENIPETMPLGEQEQEGCGALEGLFLNRYSTCGYRWEDKVGADGIRSWM